MSSINEGESKGGNSKRLTLWLKKETDMQRAGMNEKSPLLRYRLDSQDHSVEVPDNDGNHEVHGAGSTRHLTTFFGVFVPCVLSMFSVILFLRVGYAIGESGLLQSLGMFALGYFIVLLTVLSICAISTNGAIEGGGAYFMISRALGPEFGGSIGVMFFIANVFSSALYCIGFVEAIMDNFGIGGALLVDRQSGLPIDLWWPFLYSSIVLFFCLSVCLIGAGMFARTSFLIFLVVMATLVTVIVSFFTKPAGDMPIPHNNPIHNVTSNASYTGFKWTTLQSNLYEDNIPDYTTGKDVNFLVVFAVLFNGCTGIMAGANMSGELKNPGRSIPRGTLGACLFTGLIYALVAFLVSATCSRELLQNSYGFLQQINIFPPGVVVGILVVSLSAALTTLIGASRVLQAIAKDAVFGVILLPVHKGITKDGNPIVAVLVSWFLVQLVLLMGSLNTIAPLVTIFFLLSYTATNLACMAMHVASAPNFRPSFTYFSWHTSLLGIVCCLVMMFLINPLWASISIVVFILLFIIISFRISESDWGYITQALIFHQVRKYLLRLDVRKDHVKFWRPQMLLLVANPRSCCELIRFVNDMKKSGLYILGHVKRGVLDEGYSDPVQKEYPAWIVLVEKLKVKAFTELTLAPTIREGAQHLMRISGLGGMKPNTIILGFYDSCPSKDSFDKCKVTNNHGNIYGTEDSGIEEERGDPLNAFEPVRQFNSPNRLSIEEYVMIISDSIRLRKNVCLMRYFSKFDRDAIAASKTPAFINVWPINFFKPETSGYLDTACIFLLQLACVLHMVRVWKKHTLLRVFLCNGADDDSSISKHRREKMEKFLNELRIKATIIMVSNSNIQPFAVMKDDMGASSDHGHAQLVYSQVSDTYIQEVNTMIKNYSKNTAVNFCYLPLPPTDSTQQADYMRHLDALTFDLPPTVLVHGIQEVTCTAL
ncbi:solute carrier family 12 member 9-like isoform X1 [Asterias rubens]|uniref:solute carrier family 12 member 9-like isoform X1 n=2 Tax=Asterias rubens TaxID=7604 RepID=UPI001455C387|nr:solute carrier family 12 member 9-like isoform X1 [Asterias rubens]